MQNTIRTTIRIREDLLKQSRLIAIKDGKSLQHVINDTLAKGLGSISLNTRRDAMGKIDQIRKSLEAQNVKVNTQELIDENKRELQERTDRILEDRLDE